MKKILEKLKNNPKFRIRFIIILLVIIGILSAVIYTLFVRPGKDESRYVYKETKVEHGSLEKGIHESGSVQLEETEVVYNLDLEEDDDDDDDDEDEDDEETTHYLVIEDVYAVSGQRINAGDQLFKISEDSIEAVRKRLTSRQTEAKIELANAQSDYNISLISAEGTYNTSKSQADNASAVYNATVSSLQAQIDLDYASIELLTKEIELLQEDLVDEDLYTTRSDAYNSYISAMNLYNDTDVHNVAAYTSNYADYQTAKSAYESACEAIDSISDSIEDKTKEIENLELDAQAASAALATKTMEAKQQYDSAVASGETAQDILDYTKTSLESTVNQAQTTVDEINKLVSDFDEFVGEDGIVYADDSGLVMDVNYKAGDKLTQAGTMLTYIKAEAYTISIDVLEEDVPSISIGDNVDIDFSVYEDQTWQGTITDISTTASSGTSTVSYPVTIHIDGDTSKLYGGMTADVTFVTDSVEDVLFVSRKAIVYNNNNQAQVYVKNGGSYELKDVEVGFTDGTNVQIVSGLSEGDTIYIESKVNSDESELKNKDNVNESGSDINNGSDSSEDGMPSFDSESGFPGTGNMPSGFPGGGDMPSGFPSGGPGF